MKHNFKSGLRTALCAVLGLAIVAVGCKSHYDTTAQFTPVKDASVERGKMLVQSSCAGCHYDPKTNRLSGKQFTETPKIAGKVYSANLTQSTTHGRFTKYTEAEFAHLLRSGITIDGEYLAYMLRPNMSDRDISSIYAYLHSDDPAVQATNSVSGTTDLNFIGNFGKIFMGKPLPYRPSVPSVNENDPVAYGRYLVDNIGCYHCHSKKGMLSLNYEHPEQSPGYMAGGRKFKMPDGIIRGANITPDNETGIGTYTQEQFRKAVLEAIDAAGNKLKPPMHPFHSLTNKEADAIYAYIRTLAPVRHPVNN